MPRAPWTWTAQSYEIYRLDAVKGEGLDVESLPFSLKVLLENLLRTEDGADITADHIKAIAGWDADAAPDQEIQFTPARVIMQDFTGVPCVVDLATMREAMAELGGDATKINPLAPAEMVIDHSVIADVFGTPAGLRAQRRDRVRAQPRALPVPALGPGRLRRLQGRPARHRHRAPGQHRAPRPRRDDPPDGRRHAGGLPRHLRRHRLPHHDGQRHRRGRLGRRRHRGRGRDARPAGLHADPARGRLQAVRRAARGLHRHRPRAHHHRDAARARRGRQVRRVLRRGRLGAAAGQPRHDRQHEPRVRLDHRGLPDRRADHRLPPPHRPPRGAARARRDLRQGAGPLARPERRAALQRAPRARRLHRRPLARRTRSVRRTASRSPRRRRASRRRWPTTPRTRPPRRPSASTARSSRSATAR